MRHALIALAVLPLAACVAQPGVPTGRADFTALCAGCHGAGGRGDGEMAALLDRKPADLTTLSARNGGRFPGTRVMAQIWGYAKTGDRVMPEFGPLLDSETVPFDGGDGILTPTPIRLVQLEQYLRTLQQ
ncbi:c-type cytochrome [Cereibacter johrii]|uniref:Cbb3-type cytochrome c oxidase subunit III n=1 Tax=Cereibacter johrii TaxID=445629 RepID=A0ABX5JAZ9_9RHOB|nr:c-type cytochrome [Cereibacter johrii]ODM41760.1 cytochrome C [Cereibacter johrii]PTM79243.1 cbb3-type cytochrome c oxidase subunit III [Cereibacter johrii]